MVSVSVLRVGRPYSFKASCLIWVLNLLTFCGKPLFVYGWSALFLESFLFDLALNLLTFCCKRFCFESWSALWFIGFLLDLGAKFAYFLL